MPQPITPATPPTSLAAMRDRYRPLLIFGPSGDGHLAQQIDLLQKHRADLIDRQIILVPFFRKYAGPVDPQTMVLLPQEEAALHRRYHVGEDHFTVILIGKDGGEKLRSRKPLTIETLIETIDAMPMRREEVRARRTELNTP